jgi:hypothetical protein
MITGPVVNQRVITVWSHDELDLSAYWNLDFDGTPLGEGQQPTLLYAKVAYPTLKAALAQFDIQQAALRERHRPRPRRRPARGTGART